MRRSTKGAIAVFICFIFLGHINSQDRFFTQFFANPLDLNPALTGAIEGSYRVTAGYRDQWNSFINSPYLTIGTYADVRFDLGRNQRISGDFMGGGIAFVSDRTSYFNFNTNQISLSAAYHKMLDEEMNAYLSGGFSFGIVQQNLNYENLEFHDQFNGLDGFTFGTKEIFPENNFANADINVGLNFSMKPSKYTTVFLGGAIQHLFQPGVSFYHKTATLQGQYDDLQIYRKYVVAGGAEIGFNEILALIPRFLFASQGPYQMLNLGANIKFDMNDHSSNALHLGGGMRMAEKESNFGPAAAYLMVGFELDNFLLGLSYDLNLDDLANERYGQNAFEISISFIGEYENGENLCPTF